MKPRALTLTNEHGLTDELQNRSVDPAGTYTPSYSPAVGVGVDIPFSDVDVPELSVAIVCATVDACP
jgi:hypothetical protein